MIAGAAASTDGRVHEEFVCLYLDDVCEEVELETLMISSTILLAGTSEAVGRT